MYDMRLKGISVDGRAQEEAGWWQRRGQEKSQLLWNIYIGATCVYSVEYLFYWYKDMLHSFDLYLFNSVLLWLSKTPDWSNRVKRPIDRPVKR